MVTGLQHAGAAGLSGSFITSLQDCMKHLPAALPGSAVSSCLLQALLYIQCWKDTQESVGENSFSCCSPCKLQNERPLHIRQAPSLFLKLILRPIFAPWPSAHLETLLLFFVSPFDCCCLMPLGFYVYLCAAPCCCADCR